MRNLSQSFLGGVTAKFLPGLLLVIGASTARADYDSSDTDYDAGFLTNYSYDSVGYVVGGQDYTVSGMTMYDLVGSDPLPGSGSEGVVTTYTYDGLLNGVAMHGTGSITTQVQYDSVGHFTDTVTDISMDGTSGGHTVHFAYDSLGTVSTPETVTPIGGGVFHIDSFFDVFTEISIDGGGLTGPSSGSYNNGHMLFTPTPTPEPITMGLAATGLGLAAMRRRSKS